MKGVALSRDLQVDLLTDQAIEIRADLPELTAVPRQVMILTEGLLQGRESHMIKTQDEREFFDYCTS